MWTPFKAAAFLEPEDEAWHLEVWGWMLRHWGGLDDLRLSPLVTPTAEFFPPCEATGHDRAMFVFDLIKRHAKMDGWACRLAPQREAPEMRVAEHVVIRPVEGSDTDPAGTFGPNGCEILITYAPKLLKQPIALVATLIHELAHYRLASIPGPAPGGKSMDEFATDLATVYLGFGLFGADSAFQFRQHADFMTQGWSTSGLGYLRERDWVFGLAVFLSLTGRPLAAVKPFMKPHLFSDLRRAARYLGRHPELIEPLRTMKSEPFSVLAEPRAQS